MKTRRLGRTGHASTLAIFGAVALDGLSQAEADTFMQEVIGAGINHIDVAPSYGDAEARLGPTLSAERERFFLGCKTALRNRAEAAAEFKRSLALLQVERFDLYQLHAVTTMEELDLVTGPGGALEAIVEAREQGLTQYVGITGHGMQAPAVHLEALQRFDFDTVLFPLNFILFADQQYRHDTETLLRVCREREVGVMIIKSVAKGPWGDQPKPYRTWYEPFEQQERIQRAVDFVLSQDVTGLITAGDTKLFPKILQACERFSPLDTRDQDALISEGAGYELIFNGPQALFPD